MTKNMGTADRVVRTAIAVVIVLLYAAGKISGTLAVVLGIVALAFLLTSFVGWPELRPLRALDAQAAAGRHCFVAPPAGRGGGRPSRAVRREPFLARPPAPKFNRPMNVSARVPGRRCSRSSPWREGGRRRSVVRCT
jgi:hypothetical protein